MWNKTEPVLDADGSVKVGGMFAHQLAWWNSPAYIKAMVTGYGGGKSHIAAKRSISLALHNNGSPHLVVSPSYKMAKRTIIPIIRELLDGRKIKHTYHKTEFEFTIYRNNRIGKIWIGSGDNPDSLKGPNIGSALIDEPFIQDREVFDQVMARVRDPNAAHREIGLTGTPEQLNWGYDITEGDEKDNFDIELIQASTRDNKALPAQYIDSLVRGYDEMAVKAYVDGQFVNMNVGLQYRSYDDNLNACDTEISPFQVILVGMDFNVNPMSAVLCQEVGQELHACDEIILPDSTTEGLCKSLLEKYPDSRFIVYPDASGKSRRTVGFTDFGIVKDIIGDKLDGLFYPAKNPRIADRMNSVNAMFCNAMGERKAFINKKRCPELVKDCRMITLPYEEYKTKNPKRTHVSDGFGYLCHRRYPYGSKPALKVNR